MVGCVDVCVDGYVGLCVSGVLMEVKTSLLFFQFFCFLVRVVFQRRRCYIIIHSIQELFELLLCCYYYFIILIIVFLLLLCYFYVICLLSYCCVVFLLSYCYVVFLLSYCYVVFLLCYCYVVSSLCYYQCSINVPGLLLRYLFHFFHFSNHHVSASSF